MCLEKKFDHVCNCFGDQFVYGVTKRNWAIIKKRGWLRDPGNEVYESGICGAGDPTKTTIFLHHLSELGNHNLLEVDEKFHCLAI